MLRKIVPLLAVFALVGCGTAEEQTTSTAAKQAAAKPAKTQIEAERFFAKEGIAEYVQSLELGTVKLSGCKAAEDPAKWECALWGLASGSQTTTGGEQLHPGDCLFVSATVGQHIEDEESMPLAEACTQDYGLGKLGKKPNAAELAGWHHLAAELGHIVTNEEHEEHEAKSQAESETSH